MFGYRPESINRDLFFEEINSTLSKAMHKYENILFIGDLNIDINLPKNDKNNLLGNLCDVFDLTNMIKDKSKQFNEWSICRMLGIIENHI